MSIYGCPCTSSYCRHTRPTQPRNPTYEELNAAKTSLRYGYSVNASIFLALMIYVLCMGVHQHPSPQVTQERPVPVAFSAGLGAAGETCRAIGADAGGPLRREVYDEGLVFDISHRIQPGMPAWGSEHGVGRVVSVSESMKNGSLANRSQMRLDVHTGTHVDAPGRVFEHYFDDGFDVDSLDLATLNGPALLVDVPRHTNLTAEAMKSLHIPRGVKRVLFRTLNTARRLMWKKEFDTSYVGFTKDGAQWLVDNTDIKLVGVDYLSAAAYDDLIPSHHVFLESREIILVEGLKLDNIEAGAYTVNCLPLRLVGAEGSPVRCILVK